MTSTERERVHEALTWAAREAPDFAGLTPRIYKLAASKQRARAARRVVGALAAASCVAAGATFVIRITDADHGVPPATGDSALPTSDWKIGQEAMDGVLTGQLGVDEFGCPYVADPLLKPARKIRVLWPAGYTGAPDKSGRYAVRAADGEVVVTEGQTFSVAGGYVRGNGSACLAGESRVFEVNGVPEPR